MRTTILLLATLCACQATAQNGIQGAPVTVTPDRIAPASPDERVTMLNDSVRQVEVIDHKTEKVTSRRFFIGDRPTGIWHELDKKGRVVVERDFNKMHYGIPPVLKDTTADQKSMTVVEEMPQFPGGEAALYKFLGTGVRYPAEALDAGIQGVVYLAATIDETGAWKTVSILRGAHPYLDYEAWRICETMPQWTPGKQDGKPVKVQYNLPIRFTLR
jgi:TonB family protein